MTRRRIIAGVILLAAVAVAVPLVPRVWERVVYDAARVNVFVGTGTSTFVFAEQLDTEVLQKRHDWIPGLALVFPDQLCPPCRLSAHTSCFPRHASWAYCIPRDGVSVNFPRTFRCTCTDPSHDD